MHGNTGVQVRQHDSERVSRESLMAALGDGISSSEDRDEAKYPKLPGMQLTIATN